MKDYILNLDRPREIRFGFKAMRLVRGQFGERSLESLLNIKWDEIPKLTYAGLKWEDKQLTVEKVEDLLDDAIPKRHTILEVTELTLGAMTDHMGIDVKKDKADDQKKKDKKKPGVTVEKKKVTEKIPSKKKKKNSLGCRDYPC